MFRTSQSGSNQPATLSKIHARVIYTISIIVSFWPAFNRYLFSSFLRRCVGLGAGTSRELWKWILEPDRTMSLNWQRPYRYVLLMCFILLVVHVSMLWMEFMECISYQDSFRLTHFVLHKRSVLYVEKILVLIHTCVMWHTHNHSFWTLISVYLIVIRFVLQFRIGLTGWPKCISSSRFWRSITFSNLNISCNCEISELSVWAFSFYI